MTFRAFICIDLAVSDQVREFAAALQRTRAPLKLVDLSILHLTLKFLGETPESAVDDILAAMEVSISGESAFEARLAGTGVFPSESHISVVWIGIQDGGRISRIATKLEEEMAGRGFPREEREFHPHATIARVRGPQERVALLAAVKAHSAVEFGVLQIASLHLKKSVLSPEGPAYSDVGVVTLRGEDRPAATR